MSNQENNSRLLAITPNGESVGLAVAHSETGLPELAVVQPTLLGTGNIEAEDGFLQPVTLEYALSGATAIKPGDVEQIVVTYDARHDQEDQKIINQKLVALLKDFGITVSEEDIIYVDKHEAESFLALQTSQFPNPNRPTLIGVLGLEEIDELSISLWAYAENQITRVATIENPQSVGYLYYLVAKILGEDNKDFSFFSYQHRYPPQFDQSVERNAGPSTEQFYQDLQHLVAEQLSFDAEAGKFVASEHFTSVEDKTAEVLRKQLENIIDLYTYPNELAMEMFAHVALERIISLINQMLSHYLSAYELTHLCLTGKLAISAELNTTALNLVEDPRQLSVSPFSGGGRSFLGAGYAANRQLDNLGPEATNVYLGKSHLPPEVLSALQQYEDLVSWEEIVDEEIISDAVAEILANQGVVAWFQGGAELSPRVLGNRNILAAAASSDGAKRINVIKHSPATKPTAIAITAEQAETFFQKPVASPYMSYVMTLSESAVTTWPHIFPVNRPHIVTLEQNPRFWKLLTALGDKTGLAAAYKSSFNPHLKPIVEHPTQALQFFVESPGIDALVINNFLVKKMS